MTTTCILLGFTNWERGGDGQNIVRDDIGMRIYGTTERHPLWKEGGTNQGRLPGGDDVMTMFLELGQVTGQGGLTSSSVNKGMLVLALGQSSDVGL